jgi:hypothetical protein
LTLPRLWVVVALGAIGVMQLAATPSAIDLAYHVKTGELMVEQRAVLRVDVLAWPTAGQPGWTRTGAPRCSCTRSGGWAGSR